MYNKIQYFTSKKLKLKKSKRVCSHLMVYSECREANANKTHHQDILREIRKQSFSCLPTSSMQVSQHLLKTHQVLEMDPKTRYTQAPGKMAGEGSVSIRQKSQGRARRTAVQTAPRRVPAVRVLHVHPLLRLPHWLRRRPCRLL